jgi:hypothetical protein
MLIGNISVFVGFNDSCEITGLQDPNVDSFLDGHASSNTNTLVVTRRVDKSEESMLAIDEYDSGGDSVGSIYIESAMPAAITGQSLRSVT